MPRWSLAQPFRQIAHNGEINAIRGNVNWMVSSGSRPARTWAPSPPGAPRRSRPVLRVRGSRPARACGGCVQVRLCQLDASFELYTRAGRTVDESLLLMMPPAIPKEEEKLFFDLHAPLQEAWDGPAAVCYSDGDVVGARLDRNGLRPARITRYKDGLVCLSSENGQPQEQLVMRCRPTAEILSKESLGPGMMCKIDLVKSDGGYYDDAAVKAQVAANPKWAQELARQKRTIVDNKPAPAYTYTEDDTRIQAAFGWGSRTSTCRCWRWSPLAARRALHGRRRALAAMSTFAHAAYDYFKQRHAQVTNPPIDPIREGHVMTTDVWLGQRPNCVDVALELDAGADLVRIETPIMHQAELDEVSSVLSTTTLSTVYDPATESLEEAVKSISEEAVSMRSETVPN